MSESNKILDVTYGNFSCRLEGFDDSVETMKKVVNYFHDLSGADMFTQNAPAVPDVDALSRLVDTSDSGNVVVERDEKGVNLRVMSQDVVGDDDADGVSDVDALHEEAEFGPDDLTDEAEIADLQALDGEIDAAPEADIAIAEDETDDAAEMDAEENIFGEVSDDTFEQDVEAEEEVGLDDNIAETEEDAETDFAEGDLTSTDDVSANDDADEETDETASDAETFAIDTTEDEITDEASAADKLQRIRAVATRGIPADQAETFEETDNIAEPAAKPSNPLAQRLAELAKRNSVLMDAATLPQSHDAVKSTPLALGDDDRIDDEPTAQEPPAPTTLVLTRDAAVDEEAETRSAQEVETQKAAQSKTAIQSIMIDHDGTRASDPSTDEAPKSTPLLLTPSVPLDGNDSSEITGENEGDDDDDDGFNLHEEVAKIERELAARRGNELARHGLPRSVEDAMSRILDRTDLQLDLQETRDGQDAFAQLKAAVAATEAARQLGDPGAKSRDVSAMFRDDLGALAGGTGRTDDRGTPLKLVGEAETGPGSTLKEIAPLNEAASRLRKIAEESKANAGNAREKTFVDFVKEHDATDLADQLEAAAAYLCFVDGERDLSRPQLMRLVQTANEKEITREDGLRSFGRLLRQSRIVKLNNGRFHVAENTRFRPVDGKAANG